MAADESRNEKAAGHDDETRLISVNVLFFARARDLTGKSDVTLKIPCGSSAGSAMERLLCMFPRLKEICKSMLLAVNEEYADESSILKHGDEFAVIPPLSGG